VGWLIAARAVQGAGAALIMPLGLALLSAAFPPERRGAAIGLFGAVTGLAVASGPLIGGAVVEGLAWQWIFWLNVPIGLLAIPLVLTRMKESFGPDTALDIRGLALVTGAALGIASHPGGSDRKVVSWWQDGGNRAHVWIGAALIVLAIISFVWYASACARRCGVPVARVWARLRSAPRWCSQRSRSSATSSSSASPPRSTSARTSSSIRTRHGSSTR
jgi:MFS family permease